MPLDKFSTKVLSEGYTTGIEDEKQIDGLDTPIDKDLLKSLFRELKKSGLDIPFAVDKGKKPNSIKVRNTQYDLDSWKKKNNVTVPKKVLDQGKGSVNSSGGKLSGADWEVVICVAYNMASKKVDIEEAKSLAEISGWKPTFDGVMDVGHQLVKSAFSSPKGIMKHYGASSADLTKEWEQYFLDATGSPANAATKTPKTDMYIGNQHISLKKAGGSQFMSGAVAETLATLEFAYQQIPNKIKTKEFDSAFQQLTSDIENKFTKLPAEKGKNVTDYKREIKAGVQSKVHDEVSRILKEHTAMQDAIRNIFTSLESRKAVVYEAMTGANKFRDKLAKATHVMVFDPDTGKASYKIIDDKLVTEIARQLQFQINFKTGGGSSKPYSNLRITLSEAFDETMEEFVSEGIDPFSHDVINEGILGRIKDKLKSFYSKFVVAIFRKLKTIFAKSYQKVVALTGKKISIRKDPKVTWKI